MADLAHSKMRRKIPDLTEAEALTGHFDEHHALLVGAMLHRVDHIEAVLAEREAPIEAAVAHQLQPLQTIPGIGPKTAQVVTAETGGDMAQFPSVAHLATWAGVAPVIHESAGKRTPGATSAGTSPTLHLRVRCLSTRTPVG